LQFERLELKLLRLVSEFKWLELQLEWLKL